MHVFSIFRKYRFYDHKMEMSCWKDGNGINSWGLTSFLSARGKNSHPYRLYKGGSRLPYLHVGCSRRQKEPLLNRNTPGSYPSQLSTVFSGTHWPLWQPCEVVLHTWWQVAPVQFLPEMTSLCPTQSFLSFRWFMTLRVNNIHIPIFIVCNITAHRCWAPLTGLSFLCKRCYM